MDFFGHQDRARRNSTRLMLLFALAVLGIVVAVNLAAMMFTGTPGLRSVALISTATLLVIGGSSLLRISQLRAGGARVAIQAGGTAVADDSSDPLLRRYRNVAEEMAIAAGIPVPQLFVLEGERGINAFAAGYSPSDAAVAVTRGALERLNRDELQGVVAHEFSHVLNGDMRLNIQLMGLLYGILMLSVIGKRLVLHAGMVGRSRNRLSVGIVVVLFGLVAMLIGSIGVFSARLIKAALSRQREVLADASAVQFTRQRTGLAGALKKIGGLAEGSQLADRASAEEVSHMLFGEGGGYWRWFATHPPLVQRIAMLEPGFSGVQLQVLRRRWAQTPPDGLAEDRRLGLVDDAPPAGASGDHGTPASSLRAGCQPAGLPAAPAQWQVRPGQVSAQVANPGQDDFRQAVLLRGQLPPALSAAAHDRAAAPALVLALLLDHTPATASAQHAVVANALGTDLASRMRALHSALHGLHAGLRLPLAATAFPALRGNPRPLLRTLVNTIDAMVHVQGRVGLFAYCLARLLRTQVIEALDPSAHASFGRRRVGSVRQEFCTLLSVVAWAGSDGVRAQAQRAYLAGLQRVLPSDHLPYQPPDDGVQALDRVWPVLDALDPLAKQVLVEALTATIALDGRVNVAEAELLRLVCGVLHCPLPALLDSTGRAASA